MALTKILDSFIFPNPEPYIGASWSGYLEYQDSVPVVGKTIYWIPAMYLPLGTPSGTSTSLPTNAWCGVVPASGSVVMTPIGTNTSYYTPDFQIELSNAGVNSFAIEFTDRIKADYGGKPDFSSLPDNVDLINNGLSCDSASIYSVAKLFRQCIWMDDGSGGVECYEENDTPLGPFNTWGFTEGCVPCNCDYSYEITRASSGTVPQTNFSIHEPNTVCITLDCGKVVDGVEFGIWKESSVNNASTLSLGADVEGFGLFSPFISGYTFALVSGTEYEACITIDGSYFDANEEYRVGMVIGSLSPFNVDCMANTVPVIVADAPPPALTLGAIQFWNDYNHQDNECMCAVVHDCVCPTFAFDVASFEAQLATEGYPGSFLSYLKNIEVCIYERGTTTILETKSIEFREDMISGGVLVIPNGIELDTALTDDPFRVKMCCDIPQDWAGKEIVFEWKTTFEYNDIADPYGDIFSYYSVLNVQGETSDITFEVTDGSGNVINDLCEVDEICIEATHTPLNNITWILSKEPFLTEGKHTSYVAPNPFYEPSEPELVEVDSADAIFDAGGVGTLCMKVGNLEPYKQYRLCAISREP